MDSLQQYLCKEGHEKYREAHRLSEVDSKNDPETEPFKSKYKAREILQELKLKSEEFINDESPDSETWRLFQATVNYLLGRNYVESEEISTGEELLNKCLESLKSIQDRKKTCNLLQNVFNEIGIVWTSRAGYPKALEYLEKAKKMYEDFKNDIGGSPSSFTEIFETPESNDSEDKLNKKRTDMFEDAYTHTVYFLAQVYGKMEDADKGAECCHETLHRQLETAKYDPYDWALNAATLSQYFITREDFPMARHCMASAQVILHEAGEPEPSALPSEEEGQEAIDKREKIPRARADLSRCWAKYGLALLETSRDLMMKELDEEEIEDPDAKKEDSEEDKKPSQNENGATADSQLVEKEQQEDKKMKNPFNLEITMYEEQITSNCCKTFDEAKLIFLSIQKWLIEAKKFYLLDGHCSDHVEIVQDQSKLFKVLAFFEFDFERQCKMHKRRADMLDVLLRELNPQHYMLVCRQLMYELAEIYSGILDLKVAIIEESGSPPTPHAVKKINTLTSQSIKQYNAYLDSLRKPTKELPDQYAKDDERPALVAHFCLGRLHSKYIAFEAPIRIDHIKQSIKYYSYIVEYCKKNPEAVDIVKHERDICEEMVALLPTKMDRIAAEASY